MHYGEVIYGADSKPTAPNVRLNLQGKRQLQESWLLAASLRTPLEQDGMFGFHLL